MKIKVLSKKLVFIMCVSVLSLFLFLNNPLKAEKATTEAQPVVEETKPMVVGIELLKADKDKIIECLSKQGDTEYEWIKDFFLYQENVKCFDTAEPQAKRKDFYDINILEDISMVNIDQGEISKIVSNNDYSMYEAVKLNPEFIIWLEHNFLTTIKDDPKTYEKVQVLYVNNQYVFRTFVMAYNYITKDKVFSDEVANYVEASYNGDEMVKYLEQFLPTPNQNYDRLIYDYDASESQSGYADNYNRFRFSVGFWLRRGIDGSAGDLKNTLEKVMTEFDSTWYEQNKM